MKKVVPNLLALNQPTRTRKQNYSENKVFNFRRLSLSHAHTQGWITTHTELKNNNKKQLYLHRNHDIPKDE